MEFVSVKGCITTTKVSFQLVCTSDFIRIKGFYRCSVSKQLD